MWGQYVFPMICLFVFISMFSQGYKHTYTMPIVIFFMFFLSLGGWTLGWIIKFFLDVGLKH